MSSVILLRSKLIKQNLIIYSTGLSSPSMSRFRCAPRVGHLHVLKGIYGYLKQNPDGAVRFRVGVPDHESVGQPVTHDWQYSVYGDVSEELPFDMPHARGAAVRLTSYKDANLMHDMVTGRSLTGILHFINQTPIQWFAKRQNTVETATYGSEFVAARIATEQIIDLRYTLRMMGVPLDGPAWLFGDNQSVITSSTIPHSALSKRRNALSYHRVREAVAAKVLYLMQVSGKHNPADVFTKYLAYSDFWPLVQPLLFWKGETLQTKPIANVVAELKEGSQASDLRGVTSGNDVEVKSSSSQLVDKEQMVNAKLEETLSLLNSEEQEEFMSAFALELACIPESEDHISFFWDLLSLG